MEFDIIAMAERCLQVSIERDAGHRRAVPIPVGAIADTPGVGIGVLVDGLQPSAINGCARFAPLSRIQNGRREPPGLSTRSTRSPAQSAWSTARISKNNVGVSFAKRNSATASVLSTKRPIVSSVASASTTSRSGKLIAWSLNATLSRCATSRNVSSRPSRTTPPTKPFYRLEERAMCHQ